MHRGFRHGRTSVGGHLAAGELARAVDEDSDLPADELEVHRELPAGDGGLGKGLERAVQDDEE